MRLLVVDDHEVVRRGVRSLLSDQKGWDVCGEAVDGQDAIEKARELKPDLIVMDVSMPRLNGLEATRELRSIIPDCEVLILSQHENSEMARQALKAGARGYVVKSSISRDLISAVAKVSHHDYFFDPAILDQTSTAHADVQEILHRSAAFEKALRDSNEHLVLALESSKSAIFDWDVIERRGNWNPQMAAIYGFQPKSEYITAEEWIALFHPEDAERLRQEAEHFWKEGDEFHFEYRTAPRDGRIKWIFSHGRVVRDQNGTAVRMIGTHTDITEHKQAEAATGLLASIVASSDDVIVSKTLDGIITSWNKSAEKVFGYTPNEAIGHHITLIIPPDRHAEEADILQRLRRGERIDHFETVRQRKDGSLVEVSLTISPVKDALGNIVGASKIARDISAKKQAERAINQGARQRKALFRLADELHRAGSLEQVYCAALNAILDALQCNRASILLYDETGTMRFQSWRGLSNEYRAAVDGHSVWMKDDPNPQPICINNIDTAEVAENLKLTVKKEGIAALAFIPLISNGKLIGKFMTYCNAPHKFSESEIELSLTIARQLAFAIERKRNDEALRKSEERFRKLSETLDDEVLRQTEQLRNLSYELLRTQDEERKHIARELHDSAGQTLTVLGMSVAKLENEITKVAPNSVQTVEEVKSLAQQLHREIRTMSYLLHPPLLEESGLSSALNWYAEGLTERSGITVTVDVAEDVGRLPSDMELAIFRLVQEGLTNVHRHSGSKTAHIRLARREEGIEVRVEDQGRGISPERLSEIHSGRAGVGIRGMQERLRRFGGAIMIDSNGNGTRVFARIPVPKVTQSTEIVPLQAAV